MSTNKQIKKSKKISEASGKHEILLDHDQRNNSVQGVIKSPGCCVSQLSTFHQCYFINDSSQGKTKTILSLP